MKYRYLMTATAALAFVWGILFVFAGDELTPYFYEGEAPPHSVPSHPKWIALSMTHMFGASLVLTGFIAWTTRNLEQVEDRRNITRAFFAGGQFLLIIAVIQQDAIWGTPRAWFFISLIAIVTCGFGYLLLWEFRAVPLGSPTPSQDPEALRRQWISQLREAATQQERNRLARDLHDSIKQQIFSINVSAATAQARWESDPEGVRQAVADVRDAAREAMAEMEAMLQHLRPAPLENVGLIEALRKQCEALQHRSGAMVTAEFGALPDNEILTPGTQEAIFRVAQEGLNNIARHARAKNVRLRLYQQTEGETPVLWFKLQDDGAGYDTTRSNPGMGLANINTRVAEIGGTVLVESAPGHGASLTMRIPMNLLEIDKLERRSNINLAVGLVIIFFMGLINLEPPYHTGFFLLPPILLILLRLWNEARLLEKMRAIKNAPLKRALTLARSGYQRGLFILSAFAFWGANWKIALNFPQKNLWFNRFLWVSLFGSALLFVGYRIHRLMEELREKLAPQDFRRGVEQMQRQTWNVLLAMTPIIALGVLAGRGSQPLVMLACLLLYFGYLAWWRRRK